MLLPLLMAIAEPDLQSLTDAVDASRMRATVERLAAFTTRNTLSPGLTEAAEWVAGEFRNIPGVEVELMKYTLPKGRRVPEDKQVVQVVATLRGATDRRILIGGHLDSLNLQVDPVTGRAPGANDDASGVAVTLEVARVLATRKWENTFVFVAFSGEEQGLNGSRALAARAKGEGWKLEAVLNNDTVGSSRNKAGREDRERVRVFSEEFNPTPASETRPPHNSRELARFIEFNLRDRVKAPSGKPFGVKLVFRRDRFGRGGDHTPFVEVGFDAVRFIEVFEEYTRQHTPDDLPEFMDWEYLAAVARTNLVSMAALGSAAPAPSDVTIVRDQSHDTTLRWKPAEGAKSVVYWRETTSPVWQGAFAVGAVSEYVVHGIDKDDHQFAVGSEGGVPVPAR